MIDSDFKIIKTTIFSIQVCVPNNAVDGQIISFVESQHPCGTTEGWKICEKFGRVVCGCDENRTHVIVIA